jgi:hypothetical protein
MPLFIFDQFSLNTNLPMDIRYVPNGGSILDVSSYWYPGMQIYQTSDQKIWFADNSLNWHSVGIDSSISDIYNLIADLSTFIDNQIFTINSSINTLDSSIKNLYDWKAVHDGSILYLTNRLNTTDGSLFYLTNRLNTTDGSLFSLTNRLNTTDNSLNTLTQKVGVIDLSLNTLTQKVGVIDGSLFYLTNRLNQTDGSLFSLTSRLNQTDGSLFSLTSRLNQTDGSLFSLTSRLNQTDGSLFSLTNRLGTTDSSLFILTQRVNIIDSSLLFIKNELDSSILRIDGSINLLFQQNAFQDSSINQLDSSIKNLYLSKVNRSGDVITGSLSINNDLSIGGILNVLGNSKFNGTATFAKDVFFDGSAYFVDVNTLDVSTSFIILNGGLTTSPPLNLQSGIIINRGTSSPYIFVYDELLQSFRIGISHLDSSNHYSDASTQAVSTRQDNPIAGGISYWNNNESRFDTSAGFTFLNNLLTFNANLILNASLNLSSLAQGSNANLIVTPSGNIIASANPSSGFVSLSYVDGSLGQRDISIAYLDSSIKQLFILDSSSIKGAFNLGDSSAYIFSGVEPSTKRLFFRGISGINGINIDQSTNNILIGLSSPYSDFVKNPSLGLDFYWNSGLLEISTGFLSSIEASIVNIDSSLSVLNNWNISQDTSIVNIDSSLLVLNNWNISQDISIKNIDISLNILNNWNISQDASFSAIRNKDISQDASIVNIDSSLSVLNNWNISQDASFSTIRNKDISQDASIFNLDVSIDTLNNWNISQDASIRLLRNKDISQDASIVNIDSSLDILNNWNVSQDASMINIDASLDTLNNLILSLADSIISIDASLDVLNSWNLSQDISISEIRNKNLSQDVSIFNIDISLNLLNIWDINQDISILFLDNWNLSQDASIVFLNDWNVSQDASFSAIRDKLLSQDASFNAIRNKDISQDASIININSSLNTLNSWDANQDASISISRQLSLSRFSTGLLKGGGLYIDVNPSTFDISAGYGFVIDNHTDPFHPVKYDVSWGNYMGIVPAYLNTAIASYISLNQDGSIIQSASPPDSTSRRNYIYLGAVIHSNHIIVNAVNNQPTVAIDTAAQVQDLMNALGFWSISGNKIIPDGSTLKIDKTAGMTFKPGANFDTLITQPHILSLAGQAPITFRYRNMNSSEGPDTNVLDPTKWDNGGTTTTVPQNKNATIQRVYIFPSGLIRIQRGQEVFATLSEALSIAGTEEFSTEVNISQNGMYLASIVMEKTATNVSDKNSAIIIPAAGISSSAGKISSFSTLQQSYDISYPPQIVTDSMGPMVIQQGTDSISDIIFKISDVSGLSVFSVGSGDPSTVINTYNHPIINLPTPINASDAVNKAYLDSQIAFLQSQINVANAIAYAGLVMGG